MAKRTASTAVRSPFSFVVAGDSGAWPDPIYSQLLRQVAEIRPAPVFFANLGDFAGPEIGTGIKDYLGLVDGLSVTNICVVGNHDLDDTSGAEAWSRVHGPLNFDFAYALAHFRRSQRRP